jgi:polyphosphate kinase 2 (PPK2 family)
LNNERVPDELVTKNIWQERFEGIRNVERYLARNGTVVRKFFLNISKKEQKKRFLERLDNPEKNWKFSAADATERQFWDKYMDAYEEMIAETSSKHAPWYVVPADNKWYTRLVVAAAIVDALAELKLGYPTVSEGQRKQLAAARKELGK